jgi:hypothetical protein
VNHGATFTLNGLFGVCSGVTNMAGSGTTDNFVGIDFNNAAAANNFVYTAGTVAPYFLHNTIMQFVSRRTTVTTARGAAAGALTITATEGFYAMAMLSIDRPLFATDATLVTYTVGKVLEASSRVEFSKAKSLLLDCVWGPITATASDNPTFAGLVGGSATSTTWSFDQSTGVLDAFNLYWPNSQAVEIAAIAVRKIN